MKNIQEVQISDVKRAYRGKPGCMCGCRGKYFEPGSPELTKVLRTLQANESHVEYDPSGEWIAGRIADKEHCIYLAQ